MPFFQEFLTKEMINKKNTLQVRIFLMKYGFFKKRVFLSASLTLEAAIVLPLFLFAVILLMLPMKVMNDSRKIQTKLEAVGEEISQYAYLVKYPEQADRELSEGDIDHNLWNSSLADNAVMLAYADTTMRSFSSRLPIKGISFLESSIMADGETINLVMNYRYQLPFQVFHLSEMALTARSSRRAWIGRDGGENKGQEGGTEDGELVYVGRDSTRYHKDRSCHYLFNHITSISAGSVEELRNQNGKKYSPCNRCAKGGISDGSLFIMPSGESFHMDRNCSSIVAYVKAVSLSQVSYLGPCSYCSK